ncbi:MAG TPA: NYN domain-containing protein [Candidatus Binatia bacterium]|nr:NYN domain-containing protein [Candidatus Binatia bacterium]
MSKNVAMFVDVANMYYAARGQDVDVDYVALLKHASKGRDLIRAYAYTGLDPENENQRKFIDFLGKNGYKPVIKDIRKFGDGRMKANLDIELVVDLFRLADRMDIAVIVSGDGDFAPAIKALQDKGVRCEVISFKPNTSSDLMAVADEFQDIMKVASISRKEGRAIRDSMSAPEMPAKEVTPEFGFREASPTVAAAALAALKTGTGSGNGRRTRGGSTRRGAAPSEVPPGERVAVPVADAATAKPPGADATADGGEEAPKRRRRRGGRGRGRSRREDEATAPAAIPAAPDGEEIGWEEFDDLSQLDGVSDPDREYTFEEADAATLAELGIDPEAASGQPEAGEEKPKRRAPSRAKKSDADAAAGEEKPKRRAPSRAKKSDAGAAADDKPKARASTRSRKADAGPSAGSEKPKRTSPRASSGARKASTDESAEPGEDGEPQGIWGRFRSARKPRAAGG